MNEIKESAAMTTWTCKCGRHLDELDNYCGACGRARPAPADGMTEDERMAMAILNAGIEAIGADPITSWDQLNRVGKPRALAELAKARALLAPGIRRAAFGEVVAWAEDQLHWFDGMQPTSYGEGALGRVKRFLAKATAMRDACQPTAPEPSHPPCRECDGAGEYPANGRPLEDCEVCGGTGVEPSPPAAPPTTAPTERMEARKRLVAMGRPLGWNEYGLTTDNALDFSEREVSAVTKAIDAEKREQIQTLTDDLWDACTERDDLRAKLAEAERERNKFAHDYEHMMAERNHVQAELEAVQADLAALRASKTGGLPGVRSEVAAFAVIMETKLRENDHKSHWSGCKPSWLHRRMLAEANEVKREMGKKPRYGEVVARECADVANFAMMIADNCGGLRRTQPAPQPTPTAEHIEATLRREDTATVLTCEPTAETPQPVDPMAESIRAADEQRARFLAGEDGTPLVIVNRVREEHGMQPLPSQPAPTVPESSRDLFLEMQRRNREQDVAELTKARTRIAELERGRMVELGVEELRATINSYIAKAGDDRDHWSLYDFHDALLQAMRDKAQAAKVGGK